MARSSGTLTSRSDGFRLLCKRARAFRRAFTSEEARRVVAFRWAKERQRKAEQAELDRQRLGL